MATASIALALGRAAKAGVLSRNHTEECRVVVAGKLEESEKGRDMLQRAMIRRQADMTVQTRKVRQTACLWMHRTLQHNQQKVKARCEKHVLI